jgi:hypothetical protein
MEWIYVVAAAISGWAMLRIMGNERERRLEDLAAQHRARRAPQVEIPLLVSEVASQPSRKPH